MQKTRIVSRLWVSDPSECDLIPARVYVNHLLDAVAEQQVLEYVRGWSASLVHEMWVGEMQLPWTPSATMVGAIYSTVARCHG